MWNAAPPAALRRLSSDSARAPIPRRGTREGRPPRLPNCEEHLHVADNPGASPGGADETTAEPRLRVLIGADTFAPDVNGAARFAERLAAGLVERGHEVHVMAPAASRKHGTWKRCTRARRSSRTGCTRGAGTRTTGCDSRCHGASSRTA